MPDVSGDNIKILVVIRIFFLLLCTFNFSKITFSQTLQKEGLVNFINMVDPEGFRHYNWFKDSTIIFETYEDYSEYLNDSLIFRESRIYKYTILDLINFRAQDYFNFDDTATPVTNYLFYDNNEDYKNHPYDKYMDSLISIPDTTIEGNTYKRRYFDLSGEGWHQRLTYYLLCSKFKNILHLSHILDSRNSECKVTLIQYTDMLTGQSSFNKMIVIRDTLTSEEHKIFEKWEKNISSTTLPITTKSVAEKQLDRLRREKYSRNYHR